MLETHFLATVTFGAHRSLPELAGDLSRVCRVALYEDEEDRFDEVPAYLGAEGEIELILFGPPSDHEERECVLQVSLQTARSPVEARSFAPEFFREVFVGIEADATGYINCSQELAQLLRASGFPDCSSVR
jgi:hypothetical protein